MCMHSKLMCALLQEGGRGRHGDCIVLRTRPSIDFAHSISSANARVFIEPPLAPRCCWGPANAKPSCPAGAGRKQGRAGRCRGRGKAIAGGGQCRETDFAKKVPILLETSIAGRCLQQSNFGQKQSVQKNRAEQTTSPTSTTCRSIIHKHAATAFHRTRTTTPESKHRDAGRSSDNLRQPLHPPYKSHLPPLHPVCSLKKEAGQQPTLATPAQAITVRTTTTYHPP